jgi:hypothetical protein
MSSMHNDVITDSVVILHSVLFMSHFTELCFVINVSKIFIYIYMSPRGLP